MTLSHLRKKLENPFALVAEGFLVGCVMFWAVAVRPGSADAMDTAPAAQASLEQA